MARNRDPFRQALSSLRERIQSGALAGGSRVIVQDEALRLSLSTTPVREALAHLSGEGIVERAASGGYVTSRLDAPAARDRYALRDHYVRLAHAMNQQALGSKRPPAPAFEAGDPGAAVDRLFECLICTSGNQALCEAFRRVGGQLIRFRALEPELFDDLEGEALDLYRLYEDERSSGFTSAVARYHDRRQSAAGALAALVWSVHRGHDPTGASA